MVVRRGWGRIYVYILPIVRIYNGGRGGVLVFLLPIIH